MTAGPRVPPGPGTAANGAQGDRPAQLSAHRSPRSARVGPRSEREKPAQRGQLPRQSHTAKGRPFRSSDPGGRPGRGRGPAPTGGRTAHELGHTRGQSEAAGPAPHRHLARPGEASAGPSRVGRPTRPAGPARRRSREARGPRSGALGVPGGPGAGPRAASAGAGRRVRPVSQGRAGPRAGGTCVPERLLARVSGPVRLFRFQGKTRQKEPRAEQRPQAGTCRRRFPERA